MAHISVLREESIKYLDPQPNENFVDCTLGGGGHTAAILEKTMPDGKVLAIDLDSEALLRAKENLKKNGQFKRVTVAQGNFADFIELLHEHRFQPIHGVIADLGLSSDQLDISGRGFSLRKNEPLDMRFNPGSPLTAKKILNFWSKQDLEQMLKEYGEEQFANSIAKSIVEARTKREIDTTKTLVEIIEKAVPGWYRRQRLHPATKTFQALRIAVNGELQNLISLLPQVVEHMEHGGRIVIISFHSLEDRIVKNFFKTNPNLELLTKTPISPSNHETKQNPRARSAKLRAARKL